MSHWKKPETEEEFLQQGYTTWKREFDEVQAKDKEAIEHIAFNNRLLTWQEAQDAPELQAWFYPDFGGVEGASFTAWSANWVYFPICYDGREWIGKAPRNPRNHSCEHQGGG